MVQPLLVGALALLSKVAWASSPVSGNVTSSEVRPLLLAAQAQPRAENLLLGRL
jgi:hypothetical protein